MRNLTSIALTDLAGTTTGLGLFFCIKEIYIFIAIALDETSILVAVHFLMQNIHQSCDLGRALGRSNVHVSQ